MQTATAIRVKRVESIDVARALAVIGVVFNHVIDGLVASGVVPFESAISDVNQALYIFRMPALAFLLGVFIPGGVRKRGVSVYIRSRVTLFLYLYVIWFFLQTAISVVTSGVKNVPTTPAELLTIWLAPAQLWFLPFLVVSTVLLALFRPWERGAAHVVGFAALGVISLAAWGWNPAWIGFKGLSLLVFVAAGSAVGLRRLAGWMTAPLWRWVLAGVAALIAFLWIDGIGVVPPTNSSHRGLAVDSLSAVGATCGIVVLLSVAVLVARIPFLTGPLAAVGRRTLPIYLAHVIVAAATRELLEALHVAYAPLYVTAGVALGVLVPFAAAVLAPRLHLDWLFDLPAPIRSRVSGAPVSRQVVSPPERKTDQ